MSNTAAINGSLSLNGTNLAETLSLSVSDTLTGASFVKSEPVIGTSETAVALPGISTPGWVMIKNLDAANYVEVTCVSGTYGTVTIPAGKFALFYLKGTALYARANTAAVQIEVFALPQ